MHIQTVTDEMLERVISIAKSPVVVEWTHAGCREAKVMRKLVELAAEAFEDRLIFVRIWIEEHPTMAAARSIGHPVIEVWRQGELFATGDQGWTIEELDAWFAEIVERHDARRKQRGGE